MPAICISVPFKRTFSMRGILAEKLICRDRSYSTFDMQKKKLQRDAESDNAA